jgi:hypothetical protein
MPDKNEILYRPHWLGGELNESLEKAITIKSRAELISIIREQLFHWYVEFTDDQFHVEQYDYDERIGWDTYIVTLDGYGVLGYTNGPLPE